MQSREMGKALFLVWRNLQSVVLQTHSANESPKKNLGPEIKDHQVRLGDS